MTFQSETHSTPRDFVRHLTRHRWIPEDMSDVAVFRDADHEYTLTYHTHYFKGLKDYLHARNLRFQYTVNYTVKNRTTSEEVRSYPVGNFAPRHWFYNAGNAPKPVFGILQYRQVLQIVLQYIENPQVPPTCVEWLHSDAIDWPPAETWDASKEISLPILPPNRFKSYRFPVYSPEQDPPPPSPPVVDTSTTPPVQAETTMPLTPPESFPVADVENEEEFNKELMEHFYKYGEGVYYPEFSNDRDFFRFGLTYSSRVNMASDVFYHCGCGKGAYEGKYFPIANDAPKNWFCTNPFGEVIPVFSVLTLAQSIQMFREFFLNPTRLPSCCEWISDDDLEWPDKKTWDEKKEAPLMRPPPAALKF